MLGTLSEADRTRLSTDRGASLTGSRSTFRCECSCTASRGLSKVHVRHRGGKLVSPDCCRLSRRCRNARVLNLWREPRPRSICGTLELPSQSLRSRAHGVQLAATQKRSVGYPRKQTRLRRNLPPPRDPRLRLCKAKFRAAVTAAFFAPQIVVNATHISPTLIVSIEGCVRFEPG